jgi:sodium-independent sulfate anion transporter 11
MAASNSPMATKIGHGLARFLGIKLEYRDPLNQNTVTHGESVFSINSVDNYVEEEPTVAEWVEGVIPSRHDLAQYVVSLFPFTHWIGKYNLQWFIGDLIAGVTVGAVVVPQGMAYALLANLDAQFGLYSSFMGVLVYWFFATSKDVTIGPVAVLSTVTGNVVTSALAYDPSLTGHEVASALAVIAGSIVLFIGLARLGWLVNFISLAAISAYMTGSALNIAVGQLPSLMGIKGFSSRAATYLVIIDTLKYLGNTKLDAAMGLTALLMLYLIRYGCRLGAKRMPNHSKAWFFASTLRTAFVILLYTLISWQVNQYYRTTPKKFKFAILGDVPRGFQDAGVPVINPKVINSFLPNLPVTVIVMLIEHIAIAKSFGRVNNYTINPSQELVAIGTTNVLGPFLGAYPATGSFSRTAIKSKAGVRTPLAGLITAIVVLLAIYALPPVFYYIPNATLSAVIIHAVGDLITPPNTVYQFWRVSPLDVVIFFAGVIVTVFTTIEDGIYVTIATSAAVLLYRVFRAQGRFLGRVKVHSVIGDHIMGDNDAKEPGSSKVLGDPDTGKRNIFLPIEQTDGSNPQLQIERPYPGIFIYRFTEGFNYPNASHYMDYFVETIFKETRRTNVDLYPRLGDRPWNDPGPSRGQPAPDVSDRPTLRAVIIDFSSVNNVDITSVQNLIDVRNQLDRYAAPDKVNWHFACINNRWTKRALASAGFGYPSPPSTDGEFSRWKPIFSVAEIGGFNSAAAEAERRNNRRLTQPDVETARKPSQPDTAGKNGGVDNINTESVADSVSSREDFSKNLESTQAYAIKTRVAVVHGLSRPLFHSDLTSALQAAIANVEGKPSSL